MSYGITPKDFVQQVYYAQEKVILDFYPKDDKYREVIMEANLVLQELQNAEDWTWLRERLELGIPHHCHHHDRHGIPEYELPDWVYKPSTMFGDCVRLYAMRHGHIDERDYIEVPLVSTASVQTRKDKLYTRFGGVHVNDMQLKAIKVGNTITFNRPLHPFEAHRMVVIDVQRRLEPIHMCGPECQLDDPDDQWSCPHIENILFTEIPDPNYMVYRTAALHAEGSPPAQGRLMGLQDQAQKILSAMRENDASCTDSDYLDWDVPGYVQVM